MVKNVKNVLLILVGLFSAGTSYAAGNERLCEGLVQEGLSLDAREELEGLSEGQYQVLLLSCEGRLYVSLPTEGTAFADAMPSYRMTDMMPGLAHHEGVLWRGFCAELPEMDESTSAVWFDDRFMSSEEYCDWEDTASVESVGSSNESSTESENGLYIGGDITGPAFNPGMLLTASDNDWSTQCDLITNPTQAGTGDSCDTAPAKSAWSNEIPGGIGVLAGGFVGYRRGKIRYEGEYFFRQTDHSGLVPSLIGDDKVTLAKMEQEIALADGESDDIVSHNGAFNVYYDFDPIGDSKWRPYVGAGAVVSRISLDSFGRWTRKHDPDKIATFDDPLLNARIAGTTTIENSHFADTLFGYQALAGLDYLVSNDFSVGFKVRWTDMSIFEDFQDSDTWLQLRSHESSVGRGHVNEHMKTTDGMRALGVNFNMKYQWNRQR